MVRNVSELYNYRALLWSLTNRELRARYRGSVLGFFWTFLNPTLLMLVYALVFSVYLRHEMENYTLFMFIGLLPWIWFTSSMIGGATSISDRRDLLTKVKFPPQVLPATVVLTNGINFVLSLPMMIGLALISGAPLTWHLALFPVIATLQLLFTLALSYLLAAINVVFRDLQHIVSNLMTLFFFLTPVLYPITLVPEEFRPLVLYANPMAAFVTSYQDLAYYHRMPDALPLIVASTVALLLFFFSSAYLEGKREDFAELV